MKIAAYLFALAGTFGVPALAATPAQADGADAFSVSTRNSAQAVAELCRLARRGDAESQYQLAWIYAHGRGDERRDDWAAYLFFAASSPGHGGASQMLHAVSWPAAAVPDCLTLTTAAAPEPSSVVVTAPPHIDRLVRVLAPQYEVPAQLALAIIAVESNFDVAALSPKHAMGLMQLIPQTAQRFGVRNAFDAQQNIRGGLAYLRWLLAYFEGNVALVAAAYNAGEGAVDRHRGVPPFDETREYVRRVVARVGSTPQPFNARITAPSPRLREMAAPLRLP
jgi:soluble lytic murein transglycosylase-like protein